MEDFEGMYVEGRLLSYYPTYRGFREWLPADEI